MASIENITVNDFKNLFTRDFPYLPLYVEGKAYFEGDIAYIEPNFYTSLVDGNTSVPPNSANWQLANESVNDYISDSDILRAFAEARVNFNANLFADDATAIMVFCYLAAHYLVIDLNNAQNPLALGSMGFIQSKSVGSVSISYGVPQWALNDKQLGMYAQTGYGMKYISLVAPLAKGIVIYTPGATRLG